VLKELVAQLKKAGGPEDLKNAAYQQQNIGVEYLDNLGRPGEAVPHLRDALDYFRRNDVGPDVTSRLVTQLVKAMLQDRQYTQLASVVEELIAPGTTQAAMYQSEIGPRIRNEAERLLLSKDPSDLEHAADLIDAALKMNPPLASLYREQLTALQAQVEKRRQRDGERAPGSS
jgi:tetratricopeptide (TPR) repeat protein